MWPGTIDDREAGVVDGMLVRHRLAPRMRPPQDRRDQAESRRVDGACERALVAWMRDGGQGRRQGTTEIEQALVLRVFAFDGSVVVHGAFADPRRAGGAAARPLPAVLRPRSIRRRRAADTSSTSPS